MSLGITGTIIGAAGTIGGAFISGNAAKDAARQQIDAANKANAQMRQDQAPFLQAGQSAVGRLATGSAPGGEFSTPFTMETAANSTAEQYAQKKALEASQNSAAARGGLIGSNEQAQIGSDAAGIASQYEGQAFNQWLQNRQQQINVQQSLAGEGLQSAANVDSTGANLTVGAGNAAAAGTVGQANAIGGAVSGLGGQLATLSRLFNPNSTPGTTGGGGLGTGSPVTADMPDIGQVGGTSYNPGADSAAAGDWGISDKRVKKQLHRVGKTDAGVPIFTYRMKGGGPTLMGVMAQDVEKSQPRAVSRLPNSLKMVDYARVR